MAIISCEKYQEQIHHLVELEKVVAEKSRENDRQFLAELLAVHSGLASDERLVVTVDMRWSTQPKTDSQNKYAEIVREEPANFRSRLWKAEPKNVGIKKLNKATEPFSIDIIIPPNIIVPDPTDDKGESMAEFWSRESQNRIFVEMMQYGAFSYFLQLNLAPQKFLGESLYMHPSLIQRVRVEKSLSPTSAPKIEFRAATAD